MSWVGPEDELCVASCLLEDIHFCVNWRACDFKVWGGLGRDLFEYPENSHHLLNLAMQFRLKIHCPLLCSSAHMARIRKWTCETFDSAADKADVSLLIWSDYSDYLKKALWTFLPVGLLMYGASGNSLVARFSRGMHQSKVKEHRNLGHQKRSSVNSRVPQFWHWYKLNTIISGWNNFVDS